MQPRRLALALLVPTLIVTGAAQSPPERAERFVTDRRSKVELPLTDEEHSFTFAVFGDRTGGPREGVRVLAQAVHDTNAIRPDLVMTVGDLIQGYNAQAEWMREMLEFRGIMDGLEMPWYPVAGNHDVYWRGPDRPPLEHEGNYETHFGPLWYAFEHKDCWFVVLFSDETNPDTGRKNFNDPAHQRMSPEQLGWLRSVLDRTSDAKHVFVFLHHPRWLSERYGDDWEKVHRVLADAGNVTAVFAGHIHHARYDGVRDGIEYFALATTGGNQRGDLPHAGYLHHFDLVTVRDEGIAVASIPVGEVVDARQVTGEVSETARTLADELRVDVAGIVPIDCERGCDTRLKLSVANPTDAKIDVVLLGGSRDPRWRFTPDHAHFELDGRTTHELEVRVRREPGDVDAAFDVPVVRMAADYLAPGLRVPLPEVETALPLDLPTLPAPPRPDAEHALHLDSRDDWVEVPHEDLDVPDGPLTVEAWLCAERFDERVGLVAKTQNCEFGLFVSGGQPSFSIHLAGRYREVGAGDLRLEVGTWHHVAGVFDGQEVRLYVDGRLAEAVPGSGHRTIMPLPLVVGADVDGSGRPTSHFAGEIDEVRVSRVARYEGESFTPSRRHESDDRTALLLHMDADVGPWLHDASPADVRSRRHGGARVVPVE